MVKYSAADLLAEELSLRTPQDFVSKMIYKLAKTSSVKLTIEVPLTLYLRAEIFCEDVQDIGELRFNQADLIAVLYDDFLLYAKKNPDPNHLFKILNTLDQQVGKKTNLEQQQDQSVFKLVHRSNTGQQMQAIEITFKRKSALRGEVMLADIGEVHPGHPYTLENMIQLLYCDFVEKFRKGDNNDALDAILTRLKEE